MTRPTAGPEHALLGLHSHFPDRYPVLLESLGEAASLGRYDVLHCWPGDRLSLLPGGRLAGPGSPDAPRFLNALDAWWRAEPACAQARGGAPFCGGWFLYLGYELAAEIEPTLRLARPRHPSAIAWRMRGAVVHDRATGALTFHCDNGDDRRLQCEVLADLGRLRAAATAPAAVMVSDLEEENPEIFRRGVQSILDAIGRGDVYQANLSRGWKARIANRTTAAGLYERLRQTNPAPFAGIAALPGFTLLSSSPERLLQVRGGVASTRPIAGTRPRGSTSSADESLKRDLVLSEKERAEHVMLVDLERNDLGRICRGGTVRVDEFMTIETYATVHHIVSNVRGQLRAGVTPGQAIAAVFPGGTITGCPKVRCMQLLADLEGGPRDAYTGAMGYLALDGTMDLNILIRTLVVCDGRIEFRTGAGIVADSQPDAEFAETRAKAQGLLRALGGHE